jgi:hypothetical protein
LQAVQEGLDALDISLEKCVCNALLPPLIQRSSLRLTDSAKSFDIPTKQCNPTLNACSASSRFLMFCGEHPASRPSRNGYRHRWWNSETMRTRMTPNHASRRPEQKRTVGNSTAGEAQRRDWITKGRRSARLRRPRSRLRNSVGTRQTTMSIR